MVKSVHRVFILALCIVLLFACSYHDEDSVYDGGVQDQGSTYDWTMSVPEGFVAWPCKSPGLSCEPHDKCAINPICSLDNKCYPTRMQVCDDGLDCTEDECLGMGVCDFKPKIGFCALSVRLQIFDSDTKIERHCFAEGERNPNNNCQVCDPDKSKTKWSGVNGGPCDDGDNCTKDDYCIDGQCKGIYFGDNCEDEYMCTDNRCDGKGGCLPSKLKSNYCLINGTCYVDDTPHPSGSCFKCDVSKSQSSWTAISNICLIGGKCWEANRQHPEGCAKCDPAVSTTVWTLTSKTNCLIEGKCYNPNDRDRIGCGTCDITQNRTRWTQIPGCFKIIFVALNEAYNGNLGGIEGADALCTQQAAKAGFLGTFKAFLSSSKQNVKDLITGTNASNIPVVNTQGTQLYANWNAIFTSNGWGSSSIYIYTFDGTRVDEGTVTPEWMDADAWNGTSASGTAIDNQSCKDWTSDAETDFGSHGELDMADWPIETPGSSTCDQNYAIVCVQVAP